MGTIWQRARRAMDSITTKIIVIIVLMILPLNILVITSTAQSIRVVQDQARYSMENTANLYMQGIDSRIDSINYFFYDLSENDANFICLSEQAGSSAYYLSQTIIGAGFRTNIETTGNAEGLFYYAGGLDDLLLVMPAPLLGGSNKTSREVREGVATWLATTDMQNATGWQIAEIEDASWLYRIFPGGDGFYYGAFLSLDNLAENIRAAIEYDGLRVQAGYGGAAIQDSDSITAAVASGKTDLSLYLSIPKSEVIRTLPLLQWVSIILAVGYLLLIPVLLFVLSRILLQPLNRIRGALVHLKSGDRAYRISEQHSSEEFRSINQSFNEMADNIEDLKIENYEKQVAAQRVELRNLQLQIRPHFLLNMFKLIYSLAQIQEYASIQKLSLYLSNYFRYIFRSGKELEPFAREYTLIQEYLDVAAIRYPGAFEASFAVDEAALRVPVPPLLVHNFVENIFNHALQGGKTVQIRLTASVHEDGWAEFTVGDDGAGMPAETVAHINNGVFKTKQGGRIHVGIYNSCQRLKFFYGEQSTLRVESAPGEGTRFTIRLPLLEEWEGELL